jgi:hypothetical protein
MGQSPQFSGIEYSTVNKLPHFGEKSKKFLKKVLKLSQIGTIIRLYSRERRKETPRNGAQLIRRKRT